MSSLSIPPRLCVFCGSAFGARPDYLAAARDFGQMLAVRGLGLVYGGASVGLMGALAEAVLEGGGEAIGVIPRSLADKEIAHRGLSQLHIVGSMHERKAMMATLSTGFVALPGGLGTLEELFEVWTWAQLGLHTKPVALLNVAGYFDPLLEFLDRSVAEGFVRSPFRSMLLTDTRSERLLDQIGSYRATART